MAGNHDSTESSSSEQSNQHDSNFNNGDEEDKYEEEYCDTDDDDDDIDSYQKYKSDDKEDSDREEQDFQEGCTRNEQQHASSTNSSYHSNEGNNRCNADSYSSKQHGKPSSEYNESSSYGSGHSGDYNERSQHKDSTDRESYKQDVDFAHGKIKIQEERTIWGIILMKRNNVHLMLANRKQLHWKQKMLQRMMFQDSVHCLDELLIETLLWTRTILFA